MNGINTSFRTQSLYQNDGTQGSAKSDDKKQDNKNDSNVIKGAGLNPVSYTHLDRAKEILGAL